MNLVTQKILFWIIFVLQLMSRILSEKPIVLKSCPTSVCVCYSKERFVVCEEKHLAHLPEPLPVGTKLLGLSKNEFTSLSPSIFSRIKIEGTLESLVLYDNKITKIQPGSFERLINLKNLWLFGNRLMHLRANTFHGLEKLEDLDLSRNQLQVIDNYTFADAQSLRVLHLWGNNLTHLETEAFAGLGNLRNMTLGDNLFETIPSSSFKHLVNLTTLEILNLPIKKLEAETFTSLRKLEKLHIGDWPLLTTINENTFVGLDNLTYISLYGCNLQDVPKSAFAPLKNLKYLQLSKNNIKSLHKDDFHSLLNLEHLFLSKTGLYSLHESPFQLLTKLQTLDLSQNNLQTLPSHIFLQQESLLSLNLSYNNIKVLSSSVFLTLDKINIVDLSQNQLVCDCDIKWLKALQEIKIREHFTLKGKCSDPLKFNGTDLVVLPPRKFVCEPPLFSKAQENITVVAKEGSTAILPCLPEKGVPTPSAEWQLPGDSDSKKESTFLNGSLLILGVKKVDYGQYQCISSNKFGRDTNMVILSEFSPPEPAPVQQNSSALTGVIVTCVIVVLLIVLGVYLYKRRWYSTFRSSLYDAMVGDNEAQQLSAKSTKFH